MDEGYPDDKELEFIKNFDCSKNNVRILMELIQNIWWSADWGFIKKRSYKNKKVTIELHTAGWSGNEDIIRALEKNKYFYMLYWQESRRGGHYKFEFDKKKWDEKK